MAAEIKVPVRLEVLQDSISAIKSTLANLKPDSSGWRTLNTILQNMTKEADKLQIAMSKPFTNQAQFNAAEKSIEKMEEGLDKARLAMSRIKFSDIKLTPEQSKAFEALKTELKSIDQEIKQFKVNAKATLQDSIVWKDIIKIDPNAATRTFDDLLKTIRRKNSEMQQTMQEAELSLNRFNADQTKRDATQDLIDGKKFKDILGDQYSNYFKVNDYFKNEDSKNAFFEWVKNNFVLNDEQISQLKAASGPKLDEVIQEMKNSLQARLNELKLEGQVKETNYQQATTDAEVASRAAEAMGQAVDDLSNKQATLRDRQEQVTTSTRNLEDALTQGARSSEAFDIGTQQMESQLNSLKQTLSSTNAQFLQMQRTQQSFNQMKMAVVNFMGFNQVLNLTKNAIRNAINHIRELDSVMNKISIVTDMSTEDLWNQVDAYSKMAQTFGVSIKGAYEVSQIYYQQGLQTNDVLTLTNETLKLAKISGLDYATTTDYMTTAIRGFKMEMSEASRVVDVYSNLASHTAVSQEELAVAMSKTASSMEAVGATFEEASAMIGTMVAVTRESATNIGSAMKSIASRYGELTKDPTKLVDEDGEAMAFNKVDAALQSVGISMKTVDGQFRNFTDVIIELGEKWDELDSTQQRYIATQFAGNRQQSRFLALVSNVDMLKSNLDVSMNSEDTGTLQALKALDSIEAKTEQVRVAYQQFYTTIGAENVWKGFLDGAKNVINTLNSLPKLFGKLPLGAIAAVTSIVNVIKGAGIRLISTISEVFGSGLIQGLRAAQSNATAGAEGLFNNILSTLRGKLGLARQVGNQIGKETSQGAEEGALNKNNNVNPSVLPSAFKNQRMQYANNNLLISRLGNEQDNAMAIAKASVLMQQGIISQEQFNRVDQEGARAGREFAQAAQLKNEQLLKSAQNSQLAAQGLQTFGSALHMASMMIDTSKAGMKTLSGSLMSISGLMQAAGGIWQGFITSVQTGNSVLSSIPWMAVLSGAMALINGISTIIITPEEKLEELEARAEELSNKAKELKANYRTLDTSIKKYKELEKTRYDSAEAAQEYQEAVDQIAEAYPTLIESYNAAGEAILNVNAMERTLAEARDESAEATLRAAQAEAIKAQGQKDVYTSDLRKSNDVFDDYAQTDFFNKKSTTWELYGDSLNSSQYMKLDEYAAFSNTQGDREILAKIQEMDRAVEALDADAIIKANNELTELAKKYNITFHKSFTEERNKVLDAAIQYRSSDRIIESSERALVSAFMNKYYNGSDSTSVFKNNSALANAATSELYTVAKGENKDRELNESVLLSYADQLFGNINDIWNKLTDNQLKEVNNILEHSENYSSSDFKEAVRNYPQVAQKWLIAVFDNKVEENEKFFKDKLSQLDEQEVLTDNELQQFESLLESEDLTLNRREFLTSGLLQIQSLSDRGLSYTTFLDNFLQFYQEISPLSAEIRNALMDQFIENGFTQEGLNKTLDYIKSNTELQGIDTTSLINIINDTIPNIKLATESNFSEFQNTWEDLNKFFSSLQKGVDIGERDSLIAEGKKYNLDLNEEDFVLDGDVVKLTVDSINNTAADVQGYYLNTFTSMQTNLSDAYANAIDSISYETEDWEPDVSMFDIQALQTVLGGDFTQWFEQDEAGNWQLKRKVDETLTQTVMNLENAVEEAYDSTNTILDRYIKYVEMATEQLNKTLAWKRGDYSSLIDTGLYANQEEVNNRLLQLASNQIQMNDKERNQPDVKAAYTAIQEGYNTLLTDILDKGFSQIDLRDYDNLIGISQEALQGSYQNFIATYGKRAGLTASELNDLLVSAIEKDQSKVDSSILQDLTFINKDQFTTTLDGLKELANVFEIKAEDFNQWINDYYNAATGEATLSVSELLSKYQIDLTQVNDFTQVVQESIDELFETITSDIDNALDGSLDAKGIKTLTDNLERIGITTKLQFTRTKDGYKLAVSEAEKLYDQLQLIDSLSAQIVLDNLNESIEESVTGVKLLNKEVASLRATTESDDFSFMDNDIPSGQNNPINYYQNWSDAFEAIREAGEATGTDKNKIDYTDFYNIITEMGNLADRSGDIKLSADTVLSNSQDASDLITQAAGCLSVATDGSIKVDLSQLGIDFSTGAESLKSDVADGIKSVAQSQIDMLDSMIGLLEVIVAMEQLGDIDVEGNGIDFNNLFQMTWNEDEGQWETDFEHFSEGYENYRNYILERIDKENYPEQFNEDLANGVNNTKLTVGDQTFIFGDLLKMEPSELSKHAEDGLGDAYAAVLQAYKTAMLSGDYDTDNLFASIKEVLAGTGFEGEISLGDMKLSFAYDTVFEIDKDGKIHVGDQTFNSDDAGKRAASKYQHETELDSLKGIASEYDTTTGEVTFKDSIVTKVDYDVDKGTYHINFADGSSADASDETGANLAIATYAKMKGEEIGNIQDTGAEPITFTIHQDGKADLIFNVQDGKVEVETSGSGDGNGIEEAQQAAQAAVDENAAKAAEAASNMTGYATVDQLNVSLTGDSNVQIDLSGQEIKLINVPDSIELNPAPNLTYSSEANPEIDVNNLTGIGTGTLNISDCQLALNDNGNAIILKDGSVVTTIPVNELQGIGEGTLSISDCTLTLDEEGNATIEKNGTSLVTIPVNELKGEGNGELLSSDCTLKFIDAGTAQVIQGDAVVATIPISNLKGLGEGTLIAEDCTFTYEASSETATIEIADGQVITVDIPSTNINGKGILSVDNCNITIDNNTLTIKTEEGKSIDITIPSEAMQAVGNLTKNNCKVTFSPEGKLTITDETGTTYEVTVPSDKLEGIASLLQAKVTWAEGENFNIEDVVPKEPIDLGTASAVLGLDVAYTVNENEKFKTDFGNEIAQIRNNPNLTGLSRTATVTGIDYDKTGQKTQIGLTSLDNYGGVIIDEANLKRTERYVSLLQEDVSKGGVLSKTSRDNLTELNNVLGNTEGNERLTTLKDTISDILAVDTTNLESVNNTITMLSDISVDNIQLLSETLNLAYESLVNLSNFDYESLASRLSLLTIPSTTIETPTSNVNESNIEGSTTVIMTYEADTAPAKEAAEKATKEIEKEVATETIDADNTEAISQGQDAKDQIDAMIAVITINADGNALGTVQSVLTTLQSMNGQTYSTTLNATVNTSAKGNVGAGNLNSVTNMLNATGNVGFANAQGTLMGELGPELVVSNGRYFVAGQNGPEFIDLAKDAIVFNHLQTASLLNRGMSSTRGRAVTNERVATAYATGNINGGPAMASASAALAALKQLRAQWESLLNMSSSDLSNLGGSGSGGGGGGDDSATARSSYLADVERWYNWLQKIAVLEEKINTEEAKRSKYQASMVAQGAEYAKSNLQTLKDLESEAITYQALANTQQEFFNLRRSQLNDSAFSRFYTFDENGQLKYNDNDLGYKFLAELMARDDYGEAKYSAEQQYNMLVGAGMEAYMKYDSSGTEILMDEESEDQSSFYSSSVQAFWDLVDSQKEEMQSLHDSIVEYGDSVIEKQTAAYEIMKEIEDNQISVEDKVLAAIEDTRQREIDELQDQRDAIEESANALIDGLSNQLQKEQDMYTNQDNANELNKLQRQLGILQRSGGSASQIASLQKEITQKQREAYFDAQQEQIDALKEASDNELARLDRQIELMTESLEYEKANGLLWNAVYEVMAGTPEEITNFITEHDSQYWGESPTKLTQDTRDVLFEAEQFVTYRDNVTNGINELVSHFTDEAIQQGATEEAANKSTSTGSSGNGGGSSSGSDDDSSGSSSSSSSSSAGTTAGNQKKNTGNWFTEAVNTVTNNAKKAGEILQTAVQVQGQKAITSSIVNTAASTANALTSSIKSLFGGKKASGGYVSHGIYELGEQGTETVLTAQQTKILRDNILSNRPNSLLSLLKSYNEGYDGIADSTTGITPVEDNSVIIEQAVVEMHVSKIANDYDAQRAGEQALEKMLTIARKTSGQNRIGR